MNNPENEIGEMTLRMSSGVWITYTVDKMHYKRMTSNYSTTGYKEFTNVEGKNITIIGDIDIVEFKVKT